MIRKIFNRLTSKKAVIILVVVTIVAIFIQSEVMFTLNRFSCNKTLDVLSDQVVGILSNNEAKEEDLIASLKEEYVVRAKAVAHFLTCDPSAEEDINELVELSKLLEIDEIHIFDETGTIVRGTEPKYYGLSFDSGEQISYFKPMLEDKTLTMCQDMTPNTAEGKNIMYAITWNEAGTEMIQVGIQPTRLEKELENNAISEVINNIPQYKGYAIYVADCDTGEILGATDKNKIGKCLSDLGFTEADINTDLTGYLTEDVDGSKCYYNLASVGDSIVVVTYKVWGDINDFLIIIFVELIYLVVSAIVIFMAIKRLILANKAKNDQLGILKSMSDIYYSMHLIDLRDDTVIEYNAVNEVKQVVNHRKGITKMMIDVMKETIVDEYLTEALNFTDITTVRERMKDKKIISRETLGKHIGWARFSFITISADSDGYPERVMFVSRSIEDEKKKEEALIRTSNTDRLTKLLNRRAYEDEMDSYVSAYRLPDDLVYATFDVNGLKRTNDTLGHAAGDELIVGAATCIKEVFGKYGNVFRTGGDEFVVIMHMDPSLLPSLQEEFKEKVASWHGKFIENISVSDGYATVVSRDCATLAEMSILADKRMYDAKNEFYKKSGIDRRKN